MTSEREKQIRDWHHKHDEINKSHPYIGELIDYIDHLKELNRCTESILIKILLDHDQYNIAKSIVFSGVEIYKEYKKGINGD